MPPRGFLHPYLRKRCTVSPAVPVLVHWCTCLHQHQSFSCAMTPEIGASPEVLTSRRTAARSRATPHKAGRKSRKAIVSLAVFYLFGQTYQKWFAAARQQPHSASLSVQHVMELCTVRTSFVQIVLANPTVCAAPSGPIFKAQVLHTKKSANARKGGRGKDLFKMCPKICRVVLA